ncbi:MAG: hypothetical protein GEV07_05360 [Streptosporangiales bacterium]|nr:hypothetical protein [Streptosporangiales bacterium]
MTHDEKPAKNRRQTNTENTSTLGTETRDDVDTRAASEHYSPARTDAEQRLWEALRSHTGITANGLASLAGIGRSTATKTLARWANAGHVARTPADRAATGPRATSTWTITPTLKGQTETGQRRLGSGELRAAVLDYLNAPDRHGESYTPGQVARLLGRSAGAVTNALHRLASDGDVGHVPRPTTPLHPRTATHQLRDPHPTDVAMT